VPSLTGALRFKSRQKHAQPVGGVKVTDPFKGGDALAHDLDLPRVWCACFISSAARSFLRSSLPPLLRSYHAPVLTARRA
jgi:hypothetical protein